MQSNSPIIGDPADKALIATPLATTSAEDGAFQRRGTRFDSLSDLVEWALKGHSLTAAEATVLAEKVDSYGKALYQLTNIIEQVRDEANASHPFPCICGQCRA